MPLSTEEKENAEEEVENKDASAQEDLQIPSSQGGGEGGITGSLSAVGGDGDVVPSDGEGSVAKLGSPNQLTMKGSWEEEEEIISPFIKTAAYLLDVHAIKVSTSSLLGLRLFHLPSPTMYIQFTEMCLAHELTKPLPSEGEGAVEERVSVSYSIAIARLHLLQQHYSEAKKYLTIAVTKDVKVFS